MNTKKGLELGVFADIQRGQFIFSTKKGLEFGVFADIQRGQVVVFAPEFFQVYKVFHTLQAGYSFSCNIDQ